MGMLDGRIALVTGGADGIGAATVRRLAAEGATVVVTDINGEGAAQLAAEVGGIGLHHDAGSEADWQRVMEQVRERFGRLDVLVNNAGYGTFGTVVDIDEAEWEALMAVNVRGVFLCCKHAIKAMRQTGGGTIVNVASVVAAVGIRNRAAYVASKGAVAALTRAISLDHVAEGIRCNAISPGTIDTPYYDDVVARAPDKVAFRKGLEARQPVGRLGTPEEIAQGILFLAGDESRFAHGTILTIDGGMTAQ
jgi:NAD(P)-dependent dehydrogenase (short-subunit alcohol dehydrogenase family)